MSQTAAQEIQSLFGAHIEAVSQPKGMASQRRSPTREASFMLYMNTRGRTITRTLYDIPRTAQTEGGGQPQLAKGHSGHRPFVRHEGEDEDGPSRGDPPDVGKTQVDYTIQPSGLGLHDVECHQGGAGSRCAEATAAPRPRERAVQRIFELISMEGLLMKFHATRPMVQTYKSEVLPFVLMLSNRAQPLSDPVQQRLPLCVRIA